MGDAFMDELVVFRPLLIKAAAGHLGAAGSRIDDAVQETLIKAWKGRAGFQEGTCMRAWVMTILRGVCIDALRAGVSRLGPCDQIPPAMAVPDPRPEPITAAEFLERAELLLEDDVLAALYAVPRQWRDLLLAVTVEGMSYPEAAAAFGIPVGTAKSGAYRAIRHIRGSIHAKSH